MVMEGRKYRDLNYDYRYGFNGKEDDKDFGDKQLIQDYGFRLYNPALVRFLSVDPLAPSYPWYTPYQFAGNKPITYVDLDGLEESGATRMADIHIRMYLNGLSTAEELRARQVAQGQGALVGVGIVVGWWALAEVGAVSYAATNGYTAFGLGTTFGTTSIAHTSGYLYSNPAGQFLSRALFPYAKASFTSMGINLGLQTGIQYPRAAYENKEFYGWNTLGTIASRIDMTSLYAASWNPSSNFWSFQNIATASLDAAVDINFESGITFFNPFNVSGSSKDFGTAVIDLGFNLTASKIFGNSNYSGLGKGFKTIFAGYGGETGKEVLAWGKNTAYPWVSSFFTTPMFKSYTVQDGDNLWTIGQNNGKVKVDSLLKLNPQLTPMIDGKGNLNAHIEKGDVLKIPNTK